MAIFLSLLILSSFSAMPFTNAVYRTIGVNHARMGDTVPAPERNYGLFHPTEKKLYEVTSTPVNDSKEHVPLKASSLEGQTWCVANGNTTKDKLQAALDYACGDGGADCRLIQPGATCYDSELEARASFAFNSYYQKNARSAGTCDFDGAAYVETLPPRGKCLSTAEPRNRNEVRMTVQIHLVGLSCFLLLIFLLILVFFPTLRVGCVNYIC